MEAFPQRYAIDFADLNPTGALSRRCMESSESPQPLQRTPRSAMAFRSTFPSLALSGFTSLVFCLEPQRVDLPFGEAVALAQPAGDLLE